MKQIVLFLAMVILLNSQRITDYSFPPFTGIKQSDGSGVTNFQFKIQEENIQAYTFPQACQVINKIQENDEAEFSNKTGGKKSSEAIQTLKDAFTDLLKASQEIKFIKKNLLGFSKSLAAEKMSMNFSKDINLLKRQQQQLQKLSNLVSDKKKAYLKELDNLMGKQGDNPHIKKSLDYSKSIYQRRIKILEQIKDRSSIILPNPQDINNYFKDLQDKFTKEEDLLVDAQSVVVSFRNNQQITDKINNKKQFLSLLEMMILNKQKCAQNIKKNKGANQINQILNNLIKKKKQGTNYTLHCEGVAKKLQAQIKKNLLFLNSSFACLANLQENKQQYNKTQKQILQLESQIGDDDKQKIKHYQERFNMNRKMIQEKLDQINNFNLNNYAHNPSQIQNLIKQYQDKINEIDSQLKGLSGTGESVRRKSTNSLLQMGKQIKVLKAKYCRQFQMYDIKSREVDLQLSKYESKAKYINEIAEQYSYMINKLRQLETKFDEKRQKVLDKLA